MSSKKGRRIGVLMGGFNEEREVSLRTGEAVTKALISRGYEVVTIDVQRDVDQALRNAKIDAAFIALHGTYGEDGCIQGMLEVMGIPYTGSGVLASALAMDKVKSKELFRLYNIPTPPYYTVKREQLASLEDLHGSFGFPVFIKPRRQGSSVGSSKASSLTELRKGCELALQHDSDVLVERFIAGREVEVAVLHGKALGAIEIEPKREFYDYEAKYTPGQSNYYFPARLSPARYLGLLHLAERATRCVEAKSVTRVDMLVTEGENEYVLEVNTVPGMTSSSSLVPKIAAGLGYSYADLCVAILEEEPLTSENKPATAPRRLAIESRAT